MTILISRGQFVCLAFFALHVNFSFLFYILGSGYSVKIFIWYLHQGVILTKDNLAKRGVKNVASVIAMKQLSTSFFIVHIATRLTALSQYLICLDTG